MTKTGFNNPVSAVFTVEDNIIVFDPEGSFDMDPDTLYNITITTGVKDYEYLNLESEYLLSFTTSDIIDESPPRIISKEPVKYFYTASAVTDIRIIVKAVFSEDIDPSNLSQLFKLVKITDDGELNILGTATYDFTNNTAAFTPNSSLEELKTYKAYIYPGIKDCSGNHNMMDTTTTWTFRHLKTYSLPCLIPGVNIDCDCN
ncbi:MAG: Ig-like domain-containing protein [Spirochaetes bacterium]|nr:Ig-like domain-containing protein [Spirochaetota bacterium]